MVLVLHSNSFSCSSSILVVVAVAVAVVVIVVVVVVVVVEMRRVRNVPMVWTGPTSHLTRRTRCMDWLVGWLVKQRRREE